MPTLTLRSLSGALVCALALAAAPAHAQDTNDLHAVILPVVSGRASLPADTRGIALGVLHRTLEERGAVVVTMDSLPDLSPELAACESGACVQELIRRAGANVAVALAVWAPADDPTLVEAVVVSLIDSVGQSFDARVAVEGDDSAALSAAVGQAARAAHEHYQMGPGPFLFVDGTPDVAAVHVDGTLVGAIPYRERVEPGTHDVLVTAEGYASERRTITVTADIALTARLSFELETGSDPNGVANALLGGALVAAGVALAVPPLVNLGLDGQCADEGASGCRVRYAFDPARDGALLAIGGALLVAGIVVLAAQPIRLSASASSQGARLQIEGTF